MTDTSRYVNMYRTDKLECVINQSIWFEGEAKFADVILPACTNFERWDISEFANCGGYIHHAFTQCNHRVAVLQHKCIEPLGESKSDFQIFLDIAKRLGVGAGFSEGSTELDWCKRYFEATDLLDAHLVEEVPEERLLRCAVAVGGVARSGVVPVVCRGAAERYSGTDALAGRLFRRLPQRTADSIRQAGVRIVQSEAV